ncbi:DUF819 domain-containing protein [Thermodesulfobacteriota bacterium]
MDGPVFTNDAVVLGLLLCILALVFVTENSNLPVFKKFYKYVPGLLLCYFLPSLLNWPLGLISPEETQLYTVSKNYFLPASLVLLTISIDLKGILNLGSKALIVFLAGTAGIIIGGPLALIVVSAVVPEAINGIGPEKVWKGMATLAGSWIGGGANQVAMKEVFEVQDDIFTAFLFVDVFVAKIWMAFLLFGAGISDKMDRMFKADSSSINELKTRIAKFQANVMKIPTLTNLIVVVTVGFGVTALGHLGADSLAPWIREVAPQLSKFSLTKEFFWLVIITTTGGLLLSFTRARNLEGYGASRMGSLFLYMLVLTIGMKIDVGALINNWNIYQYYILIGLIWMAIHIIILLSVARIIRAPFFFTAVASQANIGGAASAPVVASAFHPSLAPVGVLLAVLGYAIGTYGAWLCAMIMQISV